LPKATKAMTRPQVASRSEVARGLRASVCAATPRRGSLLYKKWGKKAVSAAIALFAAQGAFATNYDFTGQVDNNWNTAKNWYVENGGAQQTSVPNGKHNLNFRSNATNIKASFKNNPTVNISSKYTACSWKLHVRSLGTESAPVVFNASTDANGLQVGNTKASDKSGYYIACDTGDAWLRLQKGTYGTASGGLWYIGNAGVQGHVVADSGVKVSSSQSLDICNGTFDSNGATVSGNVVHLGGYGNDTNGRADTHAIVRVNGGTMSSGANTEIGCFTGSTTGGYALLSVFGGAVYTSGNNLQMGAANGIQHDQAWLAVTNGTMTVNGSVYINGGDGGIAIGDGGSLVVSGNGLYVADGGRGYANVGGDFKISIGEGGVLAAKTISRKSTATGAQNVNVAFEGGTLKATVDSSSFVTDHSQVTVTVAAAGGTIDANGKTVTIPANIGEDPSSTGGALTFAGGSTVTLAGTVSCALTLEPGLAMVGVTSANKSSVLGHLTVAIPASGVIDGTPILTNTTANAVFDQSELAAVSFSGNQDGRYALKVANGGTQVIVEDTLAGEYVWNDGASGVSWKTAGKWSKNGVAGDWHESTAAVFEHDGDATTIADGDSVTVASLAFRASATVGGAGTLTLSSPTVPVPAGATAVIEPQTVGALEKTGAGTLTLGSSRTEQTVVAEGTLAMSGGATLDATKLTLGTDPAKPVTLDLGGATLNGDIAGCLANGMDVTLKNSSMTAAGVYFNLRPNNGNLTRKLTFEDANLTTGRLGLNTVTDLDADIVLRRSNFVLQNNEYNWIMQASTNGTLRIGMEDSLMEFGGPVYALTCRDLPSGASPAAPSLFWSLSNSTLRVKNGSNFFFGRDDNYNKNIECPTGVLAATNSLIELASALYVGHGTQGANTAGSYTADFESCTITAKQISVYNDRPLNAVRFNNTRFALNNHSSYWIETRYAFETMGEGGTAIKPVTIDAGGLVLDSNGYNGSLVADPQGPGAITKTGAGTLTLARDQTSFSALNVNVGTVAVADGISVARPVTVADGATLKVDGSATFTGGIALASGAVLSIAAPNADTPAVTASAISFANGAMIELPQVPAKGRYKLLALSSGTFAADALSGVTVSGIAVPYTLSVEGDTISISIEHDFLYVENQVIASQTIAKDTIAVGRGGFNIEGLSLAENVRFVYDPVATPIYVWGTAAGALTVGSGAKLALSANYADMTLGRIVLLTYKDGNAVLPENLNDIFDASSIASGATYTVTSEPAPEASYGRLQLVLTVGDYANDAKEIRIMPIGDSITQGVTRDEQGDYPQYRSTIAARLAASGYKPKMLGLWKKANYDASHVMVPEDWAWHSGISGDRIMTSGNRGGVRDNLHVFLDIAGDVNAVTLLIGTNDLSGGRTPEEVFTAWTNLVFTISALRPNAKIIGGTILERNAEPVSTTAKVVALNTLLRSAYAGSLLPANLVLLDLYPEVPLAESGNFFSDALHLNWKGCAAVGEAFAGAIKTALPLAGLSGAPDPTVTDEPQAALGAAETVPADYRDGMTHIFTIDAASATNGFSSAPYTATNNVVSLNRAVSKAGYYMELVRKGTNRRRYVWVDFDTAGKTLDEIDFPWDGANLDFVAEKLHVYSNDPSIHVVAADDDSIVGAIEGTHFNYSGTDDATDPRVPADILLNNDTNEPQFGWNDTLGSSGGHGGFQVHRLFSQTGADTHWNDAEVLFAWNAWGTTMANAPDAIGIGTFAKSTSLGNGLSTDYTHVNQATDGAADTLTANGYSVRHLEIWAMVETPENPQHGKWIGGVGPNMSTPENWDDNIVPSAGDTLDFSSVTSATTVNGDIDATFGLVTNGTGVITFLGRLTATSFTDTTKIAVGANATVTLDGDLMFSGKTSDFYVLYCIGAGGRFVVTGRYGLNPDCTGRPNPQQSPGGGLFVVGGFCDNAETWMFTEVSNGTQDWLIGPLGISGTCSTKGVWVHGGTASKPVLQANTNDFAIGLKTCLRENGTLTLNTTGDGDDEGHVITLDAGIYDKGKLFIAGKGKVVCNATATGTVTDGNAARSAYSGAVTVKDTATLAIKPGERLTTGAISVASNATLQVAQSGKVELGGNLTLDDGAALGFNFTEKKVAPVLSVATSATLPEGGTIAVKISATEGIRPKGGDHTLTSGGKFAGATVSPAAGAPSWVKGVSVNSSGDIVLTVKRKGFVVFIR